MGPLALLGIGAGSSILGNILGGKDEGVPSWMIDELRNNANSTSTTGFLPDKAVWDRMMNAQVQDAMGGLGAGIENFNTDLASRGIYGSGEAPKNLYSNVYAPVARSVSSAVTNANLGYAQSYQQGMESAAQIRANYSQQLLAALQNRTPTTAGAIGGGLTDIGQSASTFAFLKMLKGVI